MDRMSLVVTSEIKYSCTEQYCYNKERENFLLILSDNKKTQRRCKEI